MSLNRNLHKPLQRFHFWQIKC
uniref:Uncharacterized protein n=1 Tax=Anguilla anguilla TaxID=7936 RepID=A0A0E9W996_ANGAN